MPDTATHADLLETIVAATRRMVEVREAETPRRELERRALAAAPRADAFRRALTERRGPRIIAECKRRSPSRGVLRRDYDPVAVARVYAQAGAAAISVLTEPTFFDGALAHLEAVRAAVPLPVLRKDFVVSEYQLVEAKAFGADAVLLIVAALKGDDLRRLIAEARALGLAALVEAHDRAELSRALTADAAIVGVNNRNLRTLELRRDATLELAPEIPPGVVKVAESGLRTREELVALARAGYDAFLVGERLMTAADPGAALEDLRREAPAGGRSA